MSVVINSLNHTSAREAIHSTCTAGYGTGTIKSSRIRIAIRDHGAPCEDSKKVQLMGMEYTFAATQAPHV
jgi:hypothetical protein